MTRNERIAAMELRLNKATSAIDGAEKALDGLEAELSDIKALTDYYGSSDWHADRESEERGELDEGMPCGVLGEDYIWDVVTSHRELAIRMIELAAKLLRE